MLKTPLLGRILQAGALSCLLVAAAQAAPLYDIVIRNGHIVDGSGSAWYRGDVGIRNGKIAKIGRIAAEEGRELIDAEGLVVAPGFIDLMGQTITPMVNDPASALNLLTQGITTINAGEGYSAAPLSEEESLRAGWQSMSEYFTLVELQGLPVNAVQTIGHTQIRELVLGEADRRPDTAELERMQAYVREAMEAGAIGVSTALIYPPAAYADSGEIAALVSIAGEYGGSYFTHMRNEGDRLLEAIDEALEIGRTGNAPVHIFHLKTAGRENWAKMPLALERIKAARAQGQVVTADIYPYINNGLDVEALIHPRHFAAGRDNLMDRLGDPALQMEIRTEMETTGDWENWYRHVGGDWNKIIIGEASAARYAPYAGQSVAAMADAAGEDVWDTFFGLVRTGAFALPESMSETNKVLAIQQPFVSYCTDVGPAKGSPIAAHPRAYGAFPRLLSHYVRDGGAISLERAVAQASAAAARIIGAQDRGRIAEQLAADIIVFDYDKLTDRATFTEPQALSEGMRYVIVNGELVLQDGVMTERRPGRILRGPGYREDTAPHRISIGPVNSIAEFDTAMQEYMQQNRIPGAALAVTRRGQMLHARGYGYADVARREPVQPTSLFRIASLSKPLTAVAVMQLVEQGRLALDTKVYDLLSFGQYEGQTADFDTRLKDITARHLLEHRGGWDRELSFDPMFRTAEFAEQLGVPPPAGQAEIIRAMFSQPLDFAPGERYAYSNYGYSLLGRVIEQLSGQKYPDYMQQQVFSPAGMERPSIGRTRLADRSPGEVRYYHPGQGTSVYAEDLGQPVPWPYGDWDQEVLDSHGGWIASVVDLARFSVALDRADGPALLTADSLELMRARPTGLAGWNEDGTPRDNYYSLGWSVRADADGRWQQWHSGSLPGTAAILARRSDGVNFVALFNARSSPATAHFGLGFEPLMQAAIMAIDRWPEQDLFESFLETNFRQMQQ